MAPALPTPPDSEVVALRDAGVVRIDLTPDMARVFARMVGAYSRATVEATSEELQRSGVARDVAKVLGSVDGWRHLTWLHLALELLTAAARVDERDVPVVRPPVTAKSIAEALA